MWYGSHVGNKENLWTSVSLKPLYRKNRNLARQVLHMGTKFGFFYDVIGGFVVTSRLRQTLYPICMKIFEGHLWLNCRGGGIDDVISHVGSHILF